MTWFGRSWGGLVSLLLPASLPPAAPLHGAARAPVPLRRAEGRGRAARLGVLGDRRERRRDGRLHRGAAPHEALVQGPYGTRVRLDARARPTAGRAVLEGRAPEPQ